jgi:hypothetical protein
MRETPCQVVCDRFTILGLRPRKACMIRTRVPVIRGMGFVTAAFDAVDRFSIVWRQTPISWIGDLARSGRGGGGLLEGRKLVSGL